MEIKEAIEQLKWYFEQDDGGAAESITKEAAQMAISALEKQEAKKPKYSDPYYDDVGCFAFDVSCPTCSKKFDAEDVCPKCGQRIDWGEDDEKQ